MVLEEMTVGVTFLLSLLPRVAGIKVISALGKAGFFVARTKGAHHFLRHKDGRTTVVPVHSGEVIRPTLLTKSSVIVI